MPSFTDNPFIVGTFTPPIELASAGFTLKTPESFITNPVSSPNINPPIVLVVADDIDNEPGATQACFP